VQYWDPMVKRLHVKPACAVKEKKVVKVQGAGKRRLHKGTLRTALFSNLKAQSGRKDIEFKQAAKATTKAMKSVPIQHRAGHPLTLPAGSVDPRSWKTKGGKKVEVDFSRSNWLPDDWGQGVKITNPTAHSTGTTGGTYTVFMSPEGETFYHKFAVEAHVGRSLGPKDGFNGTLRLAWLRGKQVQVSHDADAVFFKLLSKEERKVLPSKTELRFCVVSARRTRTTEGLKDIAYVQAQFNAAGIQPTWYVDAESLEEYRALGLQAVVGGKLTAARNMALRDASAEGKACVQVSDDISSWEYHDGGQITSRDFDSLNAAHAAATRYIVSPVAAARFILAKMRACTEKDRPQLGGVYMLESCSQTWASEAISRRNFVIGDFFVVDQSSVRFDESMTLKEDYDFTCSHIKTHGSILRLNRMTLRAKHYSNSGGAVATRDSQGLEERRNIEILQRKWPRAIRKHMKRKNEVVIHWRD